MTKATIRAYREASRLNSAHAAIIEDCLSTIERLQAMTRRGEEPELPQKESSLLVSMVEGLSKMKPEELEAFAQALPKLPHKAKGKADPRILEFTEGWETAYEAFHKEKYPHGGAKDVQAIKRLLLVGQVSDLLDTAWDAWHHPDKFNCAASITIAGFASRYANVKLELKTIANGNRPVRTQPAGCTL